MKKKFFKNWKYITIGILSVVLIVSLSSNISTGKTFISEDFNAQVEKWAGLSVEHPEEMSMEDWTEEQPSESPSETPSESAGSEETESSSEIPSESSDSEKTESSSETPTESSSNEETESSSETPVESSSNEETEPSSETPVESSSNEETESSSEAPTESSSNEETEPSSETPAESSSNEETQPSSEAPTESSSNEETQPSSETPIEPSTEAPAVKPKPVVSATVSLKADVYYKGAFDALDVINRERQKLGRTAVEMDQVLTEAAGQRAAETIINWSHTRPDGTNWYTVNDDVTDENIAFGYSKGDAVIGFWTDQGGRSDVFLDKNIKSVGISCVIHNGKYYWVLLSSTSRAKNKIDSAPDRTGVVYYINLSEDKDTYKTSFSLVGSSSISIGEKASMNVQMTTLNLDSRYDSQAVITADSVRWDSSNNEVATIANGVVTGIASGTTTISAVCGQYTVKKTVTVEAAEPSTEAPTEPSTEAPTEPSTEAPTEPSTEAPTEPSTEAPTEPSTEAPTEPSTEEPTEPSTEAPTEPSTEAPTEPVQPKPVISATVSVKTDVYYKNAFDALTAINKERKNLGLAAVEMDQTLMAAAVQRAAETIVNWSHIRPDGTNWYTVNDDATGENIAFGYSKGDAVIKSWMEKGSGTSNVFLGKNVKSVGIGCVKHNGKYYWIQLSSSAKAKNKISSASNKTGVVYRINLSEEKDTYKNSFLLEGSSSIILGNKASMSVQLTSLKLSSSYNSYAEITAGSVKWDSSNKRVATVKNGIVTPIAPGTTMISAVCGKYTVKKTVKVVLGTPSLGSVTNTASGIKFTWKSVAGATGYVVYRRTGTGSWTKIATVSSSTQSYLNKTSGSYAVSSGKTYTYSVCAKYGSVLGSYNKTGKKICYLNQPSVSVANTSSGVQVKWAKVSGATSYRVYRKLSTSGQWSRIATLKSSSVNYTDTKVSNGKKYIYTVRAVNGSYLSSYYSGKTYYYLSSSSVKKVTNSRSRAAAITWSKNSQANGYQIQYATNSKFSSAKSVTVSSGSSISKTISGLSKGKTYYIRIRVYKNSGNSRYYSAWSKYRTVKITK